MSGLVMNTLGLLVLEPTPLILLKFLEKYDAVFGNDKPVTATNEDL